MYNLAAFKDWLLQNLGQWCHTNQIMKYKFLNPDNNIGFLVPSNYSIFQYSSYMSIIPTFLYIFYEFQKYNHKHEPVDPFPRAQKSNFHGPK